eukprot:352610-Chlamydomonas_euryale.AAC.12
MQALNAGRATWPPPAQSRDSDLSSSGLPARVLAAQQLECVEWQPSRCVCGETVDNCPAQTGWMCWRVHVACACAYAQHVRVHARVPVPIYMRASVACTRARVFTRSSRVQCGCAPPRCAQVRVVALSPPPAHML